MAAKKGKTVTPVAEESEDVVCVVTTAFRDKYTNRVHKVGERFSVSPKRYGEIKKYVEREKA